MLKRFVTLVSLAMIWAPHGACADEIKINNPYPLAALTDRLWQDYGYLVTYEDAPVDPEREIVRSISARGKPELYPMSRPVAFHVARGPVQTGTATTLNSETILPLSKDIIQPLIDEYNASGNPSRFAVSFDGTYAHIYAVAHSVNGRMEEFQPILSTKVSMPPQTMPCYQSLNYLYEELKSKRGVNVGQTLIAANWLYRRQCTITGSDLTARDVVAQIAHEFGFNNGVGPVEPGKELRIAWTLSYDPVTEKYYLSMNWVPDKTSRQTAKPVESDVSKKPQLPVIALPPPCRTGSDGRPVCNPLAKPE